MKNVECPHCKQTARLQREVKSVTATGIEYPWLTAVCEKCHKPYEYEGDPRSTRTRIPMV